MQLERIKIDWRPIKVKSGTMEGKISKALSIFLCTSSPYTKARTISRLIFVWQFCFSKQICFDFFTETMML